MWFCEDFEALIKLTHIVQVILETIMCTMPGQKVVHKKKYASKICVGTYTTKCALYKV